MLIHTHDPHGYTLDSIPVDYVSAILTATGMQDFSHIPPDRLASSQAFGKQVHFATQVHDNGTIDQYNIDDQYIPYLNGWKQFLSEYKPTIRSIEGSLYSEKYRFAGTHDRVLMIGGCVVLVDIKTYEGKNPGVDLQQAAYKILWDENNPKFRIRKRWVIHLTEKGYKLDVCNNIQDMNDFLVCNSFYKLMKKRGVL